MNLRYLFEPKYLFYISISIQLPSYIINYLLSITANEINNSGILLKTVLSVGLVASILLYLHIIIHTYKNKRWLHFWLTLLTVYYTWIYYIFFYEKGFSLAKKISKYKLG